MLKKRVLMLKLQKPRKAQVALFAIIAIIVVALAILTAIYFVRKKPSLPEPIQNIESSYVECLKKIASYAKDEAMFKGGRIAEKPEMPEGNYFSNSLNFMGKKIPYWLYYDFNGKLRQDVPSLQDIEQEISNYVYANSFLCDDVLRAYQKELNIEWQKRLIAVNTKISDKAIEIALNAPLQIKKGNETYHIATHSFSIPSNLKRLYENARRIYEYEASHKIFENYTLDVISLYAPVTGFEIQCSPLIFKEQKIKKDIEDGIAVNFERIKFRGDYYGLATKENIYFLNDVKLDSNIYANILAPLKPLKINVYGANADEGGIIKFDPVGNQPGIGVIGFCYVPYHLVYDVKFPLLVSLAYGNEVFNFATTVVIERNGVKEMLEEGETVQPYICNNANANAILYAYDQSGNGLDADFYFKCLDATCYIGKAKAGKLETKTPQCVGGFVIARADGYADAKLQVDSNNDFMAALYLNKMYDVDIETNAREALIMFEGEQTAVLNYPEEKTAKLSAGKYRVTVYVFKDKNVSIAEKTEICYDVPWFFLSQKKCVQLESIGVDKVVVGGGTSEIELDEAMLKRGKLRIVAEQFGEPSTLDDIQKNYELIKTTELRIE